MDVSPGKDVEADVLEADTDAERERRQASMDANKSPTYDGSTKMNHFEAGGSFSLTLLKQEKLQRSKRSTVDHLELPEAVESSLLAFINHSMFHYHKNYCVVQNTICKGLCTYHLFLYSHEELVQCIQYKSLKYP